MKKIFLTIVCFVMVSAGYGQDIHKIVKGDTLWDISGKYYGDSFKWPIIWKYNTYINNPDLIFPNDNILIPLLSSNGETLSIKKADEIKIGKGKNDIKNSGDSQFVEPKKPLYKYLSDFETVLENIPPNRVIATEGAKFYVSDNDILRVSVDDNNTFAVGEKIAFMNFISKVDKGYMFKVSGYGVVEKVEKNNVIVTVSKAYDSLSKGFYAIKAPSDKIELPKGFVEVKNSTSGKIIFMTDAMSISGDGYRVMINKGLKDGVKTGDIVEIVKIIIEEGFTREEKIAEAQIIVSTTNYSTAEVKQGIYEIAVGDTARLTKVSY